MKLYYCAAALLLFGFSLLACALNVADLADLPWAFVLVLHLGALLLLLPCACRALRGCLSCLALLFFFPACAVNKETHRREWIGPAIVVAAGYKGAMIGIKLYGRNDPEPAAPLELPTEILTIPLSNK